jgi:hypothetical protein
MQQQPMQQQPMQQQMLQPMQQQMLQPVQPESIESQLYLGDPNASIPSNPTYPNEASSTRNPRRSLIQGNGSTNPPTQR